MLSLTEAGQRTPERDMTARDARLAGAPGALGETERGLPARAATVLERPGSPESERESASDSAG
ncbi:hypothetical protein [Streptomyces broussonetiae]|uniref:Uncharacterized protein n=1 Tax=Streptomyces broussonetiae TaxID=2686304 RepID=A0A6I6N8Q3_9ACTN|nr:hypothetical protein [Streptomyces broussonetiae]QHA07039.1 hypothetical protein GQF42_30410 [Streptomyces broussonetiae]